MAIRRAPPMSAARPADLILAELIFAHDPTRDSFLVAAGGRLVEIRPDRATWSSRAPNVGLGADTLTRRNASPVRRQVLALREPISAPWRTGSMRRNPPGDSGARCGASPFHDSTLKRRMRSASSRVSMLRARLSPTAPEQQTPMRSLRTGPCGLSFVHGPLLIPQPTRAARGRLHRVQHPVGPRSV